MTAIVHWATKSSARASMRVASRSMKKDAAPSSVLSTLTIPELSVSTNF